MDIIATVTLSVHQQSNYQKLSNSSEIWWKPTNSVGGRPWCSKCDSLDHKYHRAAAELRCHHDNTTDTTAHTSINTCTHICYSSKTRM